MVWLVLSVALWGLVHSLLASASVKDWVSRVVGYDGARFFRLGYNLFSVISLTPIIWLWWRTPEPLLYRIPAPWLYLTVLGQFIALIVLAVGVIQTDIFTFVGLRQLMEHGRRDERFVTSGLYRWVRHPLYTAGLVFIWLTPLVSVDTLVLLISVSLYLVVGAYFEERKLMLQFGAAYAVYKASTPMLIPGMSFHRNNNSMISSHE